jgi:hypothetical protein
MEAQNRHFFNINFFSKYQYIKQKRIKKLKKVLYKNQKECNIKNKKLI